jgi:hypothetical protein
MPKFRMVENVKHVDVDGLVASATGFTTTTKGVNMAGYNRCRITLKLQQAGAGTATVTLKQGSSSTVNTALTFAEYWKNETGVSTDALTLVEASTLTTAGPTTALNVYVFEVKADMLDTDTFGSENTWIRMNVASISNNTAASLCYDLYEPRVAKGADALPSALS